MSLSSILAFEQSSHDVSALLAEWEALAAEAGMTCTELSRVDPWSVPALRSVAAQRGERAVYLSSGVHGDEAAAAWGLLSWAQANVARLRAEPFVICPCLNPAGLAANTRVDQRGFDINRRFHLPDDPLMAAWQTWVRSVPLNLGICLHEDYDAIGCYIYELSTREDGPLCEPAMQAVQHVIRRDPRLEIEGSPAHRGMIQRREVPQHIVGPEAIVLYELGCPITLTFETPSEFALHLRVRAHHTFLDAAIPLLASPHA